jgi:hypothetical protein
MVQFDAEFHFLQDGTTTTLYDALTPLQWSYFVFHFGYRANYFWSQLFNIAFSSITSSNILLPLVLISIVLGGSFIAVCTALALRIGKMNSIDKVCSKWHQRLVSDDNALNLQISIGIPRIGWS